MRKTIIATEFYDGEFHATAVACNVPDHNFDIISAAKAAAKEYCLTTDGKTVYSGNCHTFNWGDLVTYVPNEICEKHGFTIIPDDCITEIRDFNEQLVMETEIFPEE